MQKRTSHISRWTISARIISKHNYAQRADGLQDLSPATPRHARPWHSLVTRYRTGKYRYVSRRASDRASGSLASTVRRQRLDGTFRSIEPRPFVTAARAPGPISADCSKHASCPGPPSRRYGTPHLEAANMAGPAR